MNAGVVTSKRATMYIPTVSTAQRFMSPPGDLPPDTLSFGVAFCHEQHLSCE
jgi:hypothetical protein